MKRNSKAFRLDTIQLAFWRKPPPLSHNSVEKVQQKDDCPLHLLPFPALTQSQVLEIQRITKGFCSHPCWFLGGELSSENLVRTGCSGS